MNIYLTGLSGSGKSTLSRMLAARRGVQYIDTDEQIEREQKTSISEIFRDQDEAAFRAMEAKAIRDTALISNAVVSTGGGCILDEENIAFMRRHGRIVFIDRPPEMILTDLDTEKRPLSKNREAFLKLVDERMPLYYARCDEVLANEGTAEEALEKLAAMTEGWLCDTL